MPKYCQSAIFSKTSARLAIAESFLFQNSAVLAVSSQIQKEILGLMVNFSFKNMCLSRNIDFNA